MIVLNVHAPSEDESNYSEDSFYIELEQVFYHFPKYHLKTVLEDLMQRWGERIFSNCHFGIRV
jgi:hypothetical protein